MVRRNIRPTYQYGTIWRGASRGRAAPVISSGSWERVALDISSGSWGAAALDISSGPWGRAALDISTGFGFSIFALRFCKIFQASSSVCQLVIKFYLPPSSTGR